MCVYELEDLILISYSITQHYLHIQGNSHLNLKNMFTEMEKNYNSHETTKTINSLINMR